MGGLGSRLLTKRHEFRVQVRFGHADLRHFQGELGGVDGIGEIVPLEGATRSDGLGRRSKTRFRGRCLIRTTRGQCGKSKNGDEHIIRAAHEEPPMMHI
jgi:hypothetical protein